MERVKSNKAAGAVTGRISSQKLAHLEAGTYVPLEMSERELQQRVQRGRPRPDPKDVPQVDTSGYGPLVLVPGSAKVRLGWRVKDHGDGTEAWLWYVGVVLVAVAAKSPMSITMTCRHALSGLVQNEHRTYDTMQELQRDLLAMLQEPAP